MRDLHVVALSEDGRHVLLAARDGAAAGEFRVALDGRLAAAVRGELPAPGRTAAPSISPRDIQARLRDGETSEQIAAAAGVPLSRVERYAGPVLAELDRMITGARSAFVHRPRLGRSALPLGAAVEAHLAEVAHLAEGSVRWGARRTDLGRWVVQVSWTARGRRRTAGWQYDPGTREVVAIDGPSAVLGHVEDVAAAHPASGAAARLPVAATAPGAGRSGAARQQVASAAGGRAVRAQPAPTPVPRRTGSGPAGPPRTAPSTAEPARTARARPAARTTSQDTTAAAGTTGRRATTAPFTDAPFTSTRGATTPRATAGATSARDVTAPRATAGRTSARNVTAPRATAARSSAGEDTAARTGGPAARTSGSRAAVPRPPAARATPETATPETASPETASPETATPPTSASTRRRPAASATDPARATATPPTAVAAAPPGQPRRAAPRRRAVPSLDDLTTVAAEPAPGPSAPGPTAPHVPSGPPLLRVVPPAEHDADREPEGPPTTARPTRRAAGDPAGGRNWADVLMGSAPDRRAGEPQREP